MICTMTANKLLALLPDTLLEELAIKTGVNKYSKKLQGEVVFKLLLYCLTMAKNNIVPNTKQSQTKLIMRLLLRQLAEKQ